MKIFTFFLLAYVICQSAALAGKKITFSCNEIDLASCIEKIKNISGLTIKGTEFFPKITVSASATDATPAVALSLVLNSAGILNYSLQQVDSTVVVSTLSKSNTDIDATENQNDFKPSGQEHSTNISPLNVKQTQHTISLDDDVVIGDEVMKYRDVVRQQERANISAVPPDTVVFEARDGQPAVTVKDLTRLQREANAMVRPSYDLSKPNWYEKADPELRKMMNNNVMPADTGKSDKYLVVPKSK